MDSNLNLLSQEALQTDWDTLSTRIANAIEEITKLSAAAKEITFNIQGGDTFLSVINRMNESEKFIVKITGKYEEMKDVVNGLNIMTVNYGETLSKSVKEAANFKTQIIEERTEITLLTSELLKAEKALNLLATVNVRSGKDFEYYSNIVATSKQKINELEQSVIKTSEAIKQLNPIIAQSNIGFQNQQTAINELSVRVAILTSDWNKLSATERAAAENQPLLQSIQSLNVELGFLQKQALGSGTSLKAMADLEVNLANAKAKLTTLTNEEAIALSEVNVQISQQNKLNKLNAELGLSQADTYANMSAEYRLLDIEVKKYTLDQIKSGEVDQELIERHKFLSNALKEYDAILGVTTRNVGNYKSANQALSNTKAEMVAIVLKGNEATNQERIKYEELRQEAIRLTEAQEQVNAATKKLSISAKLQQYIFRDLFRFIALYLTYIPLTMAVQGLEELFKWLFKTGEQIEKVKDALEKYDLELKSVSKELDIVIEKEQLLNDVLLQTAQNATISFDKRIEAVNKYRQSYGSLLDMYSDEQIISKNNDVFLKVTEADRLRRLQEESKQRLDIKTKEIQDLNKQEAELQAKYKTTPSYHPIDKMNISQAIEEVKTNQYLINRGIDPITKKKASTLGQLKEDYESKTQGYQSYINNSSNQNIISKLQGEIAELEETLKRKDYSKYGITSTNLTKEQTIALKKNADIDPEFKNQIKQLQDKKDELDVLLGKKDPKGKHIGASDYEKKKKLIEGNYDIEKEFYGGSAKGNEDVMNDYKKSKEERLKANSDYQANKITLLAAENAKEHLLSKLDIEYKKTTKDAEIAKMKAMDIKYYEDAAQITKEGTKKINEIVSQSNEKWIKSSEEKQAEQKAIDMQGYIVDEQLYQDLLDKKFISTKQYNKKITELKKKENELSIEIDLWNTKALLGSGKASDDEIIKYQEKINRLEKELSDAKSNKKSTKKEDSGFNITDPIVDLFNDGNLDSDDGKLARAKQEFWDKSVEMATTAMDAINTIRNNAFEKEQMQLDIQMRQVQLQSNQKIQAIEASSGYAVQKSNEEQLVAAQAASKENQIQQQSNQIQLKQAEANKTAAESAVILNTALAITKIFTEFPFYLAVPIAAIQAGIGAAQYAAAASTPLPQFWMGGKTETPYFSAGERGVELITPIDKPSYFTSSTASIYKEKPGAIVTPHDKTMKMVEFAVANYAPDKTKEINNINLEKIVENIGNKIEDSNHDLIYAIMRSKQSQTNIILNSGINPLTYKIQSNNSKRR